MGCVRYAGRAVLNRLLRDVAALRLATRSLERAEDMSTPDPEVDPVEPVVADDAEEAPAADSYAAVADDPPA